MTLAQVLLGGGQRQPEIYATHAGHAGLGIGTFLAQEIGHFRGRGRAAFHQQAQLGRLGLGQPERALAAPGRIEKARVAPGIVTPAGAHTPAGEIAVGAADQHAQAARIGELLTQLGQAQHAGTAAELAGLAQAHQQP